MVWTFSQIATRFFRSNSRPMACRSASLSGWHHQPGQSHSTCAATVGSGRKTNAVLNASHSSGLARRWTTVAQSATCRSILKPTSSSWLLEVGFKIDLQVADRSEEHTSELQSRSDLVCRLLLE